MRFRPALMPVVASIVALAGCAAPGEPAGPSRDPGVCLALFDQYDTAVWLYPGSWLGSDDDTPALQSSDVSRPMQKLRTSGCLTRPGDLDGMEAVAERLSPHVVTDSGPAIPPTTVQVGIITSFQDSARAARFFRSLGYRARGIGAEGLGRRLFIGPFTSQGALDEALSIARQAGFIAPLPAKHTRF